MRLTINCHAGNSGNAGMIDALLKHYGMTSTTNQIDPQILHVEGYGLDQGSWVPGLFVHLAELVMVKQIQSYTLTNSKGRSTV